MIQHIVPVVENVLMAERTYRLRVSDPEIGRLVRPGQFVMLRIPACSDPLLGRPFALYDTYLNGCGDVAGYDLVYLVIGKMTTQMSRLRPGDTVEVWGPLGNGFSLTPTRHLVIVAGGIGQTPFPAVARAYLGLRQYGAGESETGPVVGGQWSVVSGQRFSSTSHHAPLTAQLSLCYGVRSAGFLAGLDDFRSLGVDVSTSTDDGSVGHRGFVTDLVKRMLESDNPPTRLLGCGPEPMMRALAKIAESAKVSCELSLETPMACGIGACFSCVAKIRQNNTGWDYRRVCVEGPVFDSSLVIF